MSIRRFSPEMVRCFLAVLIASLLVLASPAPWQASADERGMIGITFRQLFADAQPNHRGPLVVLHVIEDSPAAKAGIHCSDFVVAINGTPVPGRDFSEILTKDLQGPVGGTVRLTVSRYDGSQSEITLVRVPYPTHVSQATDPFVYRVPGTWSTDPRYVFPLPWWQKIPYRGFEDVFFSPNFDHTDSPEYHSFLFFLWIEGTHMMSAEQLQSDAVAYFRGIAEERGRNYDFTPDVFQSIGDVQGGFSDINVRWRVSSCVQRNFDDLRYPRQSDRVELRGSDLDLWNAGPHRSLLRPVARAARRRNVERTGRDSRYVPLHPVGCRHGNRELSSSSVNVLSPT
jgi:hypothetical protein